MITDETQNTQEDTDETIIIEEEQYSEPSDERKVNLLRHTETIDKLVLQNKQLYKQINENENIIEDLEQKISESSIKISKNLFYVIIVVLGYFIWSSNKHLTEMNNSILKSNMIISEYKNELERSRQLNELLIQKNDRTNMEKR